MGKIKCPYCFEEFESDKVLFRANTGFTQEELDRENSPAAMWTNTNGCL